MPWDKATMRQVEKEKRMKVGERLKCGCRVVQAAWTREEATSRVYEALAEALSKSVEDTGKIPETMVLRSLGLDTAGLRRLWGKFFVACDVDFKTADDGSVEYQVADSKLPLVPASIKGLIDEVAQLHSMPTFASCAMHLF